MVLDEEFEGSAAVAVPCSSRLRTDRLQRSALQVDSGIFDSLNNFSIVEVGTMDTLCNPMSSTRWRDRRNQNSFFLKKVLSVARY